MHVTQGNVVVITASNPLLSHNQSVTLHEGVLNAECSKPFLACFLYARSTASTRHQNCVLKDASNP